MNKNDQLLPTLYRCASMGRQSVDRLLPYVEYPPLIAELASMRQDYGCVKRDCERRIRRSGGKPRPVSGAARAAAGASMRAHLSMRRDRSAIAKMIIQGNVMAIIEVTRALNSSASRDSEAVTAARDFVASQQQAIESMKAYL